ncbi:MAG: hypothetical protein KKG88_09560 [Proteobacteria bacterium]|jgi:hypothetical protein|nr:hypothetical protein [Pseudomonadota bacterium]MBU4230536.1 hypothetical protein [Pseudomonadota bacterium]
MVQNSDFFKHISGLAEPGGYRLDFIDRGAYVAQLKPLFFPAGPVCRDNMVIVRQGRQDFGYPLNSNRHVVPLDDYIKYNLEACCGY